MSRLQAVRVYHRAELPLAEAAAEALQEAGIAAELYHPATDRFSRTEEFGAGPDEFVLLVPETDAHRSQAALDQPGAGWRIGERAGEVAGENLRFVLSSIPPALVAFGAVLVLIGLTVPDSLIMSQAREFGATLLIAGVVLLAVRRYVSK